MRTSVAVETVTGTGGGGAVEADRATSSREQPDAANVRIKSVRRGRFIGEESA
jgi:hypothetical protein